MRAPPKREGRTELAPRPATPVASPWHYVAVSGATYDHAPPEGDAVEALIRFRKTLLDPNANRADKQLALRFIVHLVAIFISRFTPDDAVIMVQTT